MSSWFLEGYIGGEDALTKLHLKKFPEIVGRNESLSCSILSPCVSRQHARFEETSGQLSVTDLQSSNGTYVNHELISSTTELNHGDVLHFGDLELRIIDRQHSSPESMSGDLDEASQTVFMSKKNLSNTFPAGVLELEELIVDRRITPVFQPILDANGLSCSGYEALGRGSSNKIPQSPLALFDIAESVGLEVSLSNLMRTMALEVAAKYKLKGDIWVNTHPSEMKQPDQVLASMRLLRKRHPNMPLIFEVHEQCVTDVESLRSFKEALNGMDIRIAFDDFGVGQSRLMEIVEAKPDVLKFDKVLIEGIDRADEGRVSLLRHLKDMASEMKIKTLAECVETKSEYEVCDEMGFDLYQGYYFAKPQPPKNFKRR